MSNERFKGEDKEREQNISVVSVAERTPSELIKNLFSLGTENIHLIDRALKDMDYAALEDMVSESYFENTGEIARAALANLVTDMKYTTSKDERKQIAHKIALSIEAIGLH